MRLALFLFLTPPSFLAPVPALELPTWARPFRFTLERGQVAPHIYMGTYTWELP